MNNTNNIDQLSDNLITWLRGKYNNPTISYASPLTQLQGGYETQTYRFQLNGLQDEALAAPLVLRLHPLSVGAGGATWERTVQNALADAGFPVARVYATCTDLTILGGAFLIMAFLPGETLLKAPLDKVPGLLGKIHADLHQIDPTALISALQEEGIAADRYSISNRFNWLANKTRTIPWLAVVIQWLLEQRPPEPEQLAICHGDFHPLNILVYNNQVSGVLDWPNFSIADPVADVGSTIVLATIPARNLPGFPSIDWDDFSRQYLEAYRSHQTLNTEHLAYYRVKRCVEALIQGFEGQQVWQHPLVVKDLIGYIHNVTGLTISRPE